MKFYDTILNHTLSTDNSEVITQLKKRPERYTPVVDEAPAAAEPKKKKN